MPLPPSFDPRRTIADLHALADRTGGLGTGGSRRLAWSDEWLAGRAFLRERLAELPVRVEQDEAGNIWAYLDGARPETVVVGSHVDSVPSGGWLDGALGVFAALEVLRSEAASGTPPCTVALVDWADEEGARFGRSLLGSSATAGTLDPDLVRDLTDRDGIRLEDALRRCGVELDRMGESRTRLADVRAYLELHIEQGPVLESEGLMAAAVVGTVGVERWKAVFTGQAAHAGSTPMHLRRDSLLAAAQTALALREVGIRNGGMCTTGAATATPGIITAVAGRTELLVDQRHLDADVLARMLAEAQAASEEAAAAFGCTVAWERVWGIEPLPFDAQLLADARAAVLEVTGVDRAIPSGPLHDAAEMARLVPTVMLFSSSTNGLSHTEVEDTPEEHLEAAIAAFGITARTAIERVGRG